MPLIFQAILMYLMKMNQNIDKGIENDKGNRSKAD